MQMHVDGADQRRIGQAEIDRPAHRVDIPVIEAGVLAAARANREPDGGSQERGEHRQWSRRSGFFLRIHHHNLPVCVFLTNYDSSSLSL
jgi:hypothetical protein